MGFSGIFTDLTRGCTVVLFLFSQFSHFIAHRNSLDSIAYSSILTQSCLGEFLYDQHNQVRVHLLN